jgi:hypothetical protein
MGGTERLALYRLFRVPVAVPVGFAVALRSIELVESLECFRDCSDAAYKQNYQIN